MPLNVFFLLLSMMLCGALPLHAQEALPGNNTPSANSAATGICIVDKTVAVDGLQFQSCDAAPEDGALLKRGLKIARLDRNTVKSHQPIWAHTICRYIDNRSANRDVLVPFGTEEEWQTFLKFVPDILHVAGCCVPQRLTLEDIPVPQTPCAGRWKLSGVVAAADLPSANAPGVNSSGAEADAAADAATGANAADQKILVDKMHPEADGSLSGITGQAVIMPLQRDDTNTVFAYDGVKEFAARWSCEVDPGETPPPALTVTTEGENASAKNLDTLYTHFYWSCVRERWVPVVLPPLCAPFEGNKAYPCEQYGYAPGTAGDVIVQEKTVCPSGATTRTVIKEECEGEKIQGAGALTPTAASAPANTASPAPAGQ